MLRSLALVAVRLIELRHALQQRTQEARQLAESRERMRQVADHAPIGIFYADEQLDWRYVNQTLVEITQRDADTLHDHLWRRFVHADDMPEIARVLANAVSTGNAFDVYFRMSRPTGELRQVRMHATPIFSTAGTLAGFVGTVDDLTGYVELLNRLSAREDQLRRLYEATPVMMHSIDEKSQIVAVSDLWLEKLGYRRDEVIGHKPMEFMTPESAERLARDVAPAFNETGVVKDVDAHMVHKSGAVVEVRVSAIRDELEADVRETRVLAVLEDITERYRAERALKEALDRMKLATDSGRIGIWDWDLASQRWHCDDLTRTLFGLSGDGSDFPWNAFFDQLHQDDKDPVRIALDRAIEDGLPLQLEFRVDRPDQHLRYLKMSAHILRDPRGEPTRLIGALIDVTEQRALTAALADQHELLRVTLESIADAVISTNADGAITWLNPVAEHMTGWTSAEAMGRPLMSVFRIADEAADEPMADPTAACLATGATIELSDTTVLITRNERCFGIEATAAPIRGVEGSPLGIVIVFRDVTEQRRLSSEMRYRASHDPLTGLVNRLEFEQRLTRALHRAQTDGIAHALVYIDLDRFKPVNDTCGHAVGDLVLQKVAVLFRDAVRETDTVARIGGDEFAFILEHCTGEAAKRVAEIVCARIGDHVFTHEDHCFRIGASVGVVAIDWRWKTIEEAVHAADLACYAAKEAGRGRVHMDQLGAA
jgi:diguanylate cyclase (GGDEF)-like protein/PAS domain S-box-containing protein